MTAAFFAGDGSALTGIAASVVTAAGVLPGALGASVIASSVAVNSIKNANQLAGTLSIPDANLSANVSLLSAAQTFSGAKTFTAGPTMSNVALTLTGASGAIFAASSITAAGGFFGDGSGLTGVLGTDTSRVAKTGDTMTGPLTLTGSTLTVTGAVGIGATDLSNGTLVVVSTSSTLANPVADFRNSAGFSLLQVQQGGSVGVGTAPAGKLHVAGSSDVRQLIVSMNATQTANAQEWINFGGTTVGAVDPNGGYHVKSLLGENVFTGGPGGVGVIGTQSETDLTLQTFGSEKARITSDGDVGIGATAPEARLHVSSANPATDDMVFLVSSGTASGQKLFGVTGDGRVGILALESGARLTVQADAMTEIRFPPGTSNVEIESSNQMVVGTYGGSDFILQSSGQERLRVAAGGNIGIGTSSPASKLHVSSGAIIVDGTGSGVYFADGSLQTTAAGSSQWLPNGLDVYNQNYAASGKVGVGTSVPASTLHVVGDTSLSGPATVAGSSLTVGSALGVGGGIVALGGADAAIPTGGGARFMWVASRSALRAGGVDTTEWDLPQIGTYSTAFGRNSVANNSYATVGGGFGNSAGGAQATVSGGASNQAGGDQSFVGAGQSNSASGFWATVPGGANNSAAGNYSFAAGQRAKANAPGSFVWADSQASDFNNSVTDSFAVRAQGGVLIQSSMVSFSNGASTTAYFDGMGRVGLGTGNPAFTLDVYGDVRSTGVFIGSGAGLTNVTVPAGSIDASRLDPAVLASVVQKSGDYMTGPLTLSGSSLTVTGGGLLAQGTSGGVGVSGAGTRFMWIPARAAIRAGTVSGTEWDAVSIGNNSTAFGSGNTASGSNATVSGGNNNGASGSDAVVGGGNVNFATNFNATIAGGQSNMAAGQWSTVPGGRANSSSGDYSFAAGRQAKANAQGAFVWADSQGLDLLGNVTDQFLVRAQGGFAVNSSSVDFNNGGSPRLIITPAGNVGIGTSAPATRLYVSGETTLAGNTTVAASSLTVTGVNGILVKNAATTTPLVIENTNGSGRPYSLNSDNSGSFFVRDDNSAQTRMKIDSTGTIYLGSPGSASRFSAGGNLYMALGSSLTLYGAAGSIVTGASVTASGLFAGSLHIASGTALIDGTGAALQLNDTRAMPGGHRWTIDNGASALGQLDIADLDSNTGNTTRRLTLDSNGRVGISTGLPSYDLSFGLGGDKTIAIETPQSPAVAANLTIRSGHAFVGGGQGGNMTVQAGNAGTSGGPGGSVTVQAGNGGGASGAGGSVVLNPGPPTGAGFIGYVEIAGANAGSAHLRVTQSFPPQYSVATCAAIGPAGITGGTDMAGSFSFTSTGAGLCDVTLTFNKSYASVPKAFIITPMNANAAVGQPYVDDATAPTLNAFHIRVNVSGPGQLIRLSYVVIE